MTVPYIHDQVFEDIRRNGLDKPVTRADAFAFADATRIGQKQPKATAGEVGRQTMRGLGRAGLGALFFPHDIAKISAGAPQINPAVTLGSLLYNATIGRKVEAAEQAEYNQLDEFWGVPVTGGGREAALLAEIAGSLAIPLGPVKRAPGASRIAPRTVPVVRAATDAEVSKVVGALRRAPEGSRERRLLEDMMREPTPKLQRRNLDPSNPQPPVDVSPGDLEELLNLRAFGSKRGPFSTSGKHNYDLVGPGGIGNIPPIASADEVFAFTKSPKSIRQQKRRYTVTEQMRDPDMMSGKAAQQEIHLERQREELLNTRLRGLILDEGVVSTGRSPLKVQPRSLWEMFFTPKGSKQ